MSILHDRDGQGNARPTLGPIAAFRCVLRENDPPVTWSRCGLPHGLVMWSGLERILTRYPGVPGRHANSTIMLILTRGVTAWMFSVGYREAWGP
jgi:hypothetical protein